MIQSKLGSQRAKQIESELHSEFNKFNRDRNPLKFEMRGTY